MSHSAHQSNQACNMTPLTRQLHEILNIGQSKSSVSPYCQLRNFETDKGNDFHNDYKSHLARASDPNKNSDNDWSFFSVSCDSKWAPALPQHEKTSYAVPKASDKNHASLEFYNSFKNDQHPKLWEGDLEKRDFSSGSGIFSKKIFIGGIQRDMTEEDIVDIFSEYDKDATIEWPESRPNSRNTPKGYLYIIFSTNENVRNLLYACDLVIEGGCETFNFNIIYKKKHKQLQVIPWQTSDSKFAFCEPLEAHKSKFTVFIGALHGRLHAKAIAFIFNKMFGDVILVTIDTDRHKYPTGSGRVTFGSAESYTKAIIANFIQIEAKKLSKKVQIEPCIDGQKCYVCAEDDAPNFCKEPQCFEYFCNHCWEKQHMTPENLNHFPIRRKSKFEY